jgi:L-iditol 2-dehydrogenase
MAVRLVRRGGRLVLAGIPEPGLGLHAFDLVRNRIEVHTVFGAPHAGWSDAVAAFEAGVLVPSTLVTHELELEAALDALTLLSSGAPEVGKVLLRAGTS